MRVLAGAPAQQNQQNPGPRLAPMSPRFQTVVGQVYTIALQFATGRPVTSRYDGKTQVMYTLTTGQKAYFDPPVAQAIDSLTLAPGQPFTICHRGGGNWDIDRCHEQPPQAPSYQPPQAPRPQPPTPPYPPAAADPYQSGSPQLMNGAGEDLPAILTRCYAGAIDVTVAAVEAARAKGLTFLPTHEGLQACAATLFIAETRRQS